jgi:hypothetical protein
MTVDALHASEIALDQAHHLRISRRSIRGRDLVEIRIWSNTGPQFFPSGDGLALSAEHLSAFISALIDLERELAHQASAVPR